MTEANYFKLALAAPLVVPAAAWLFSWVGLEDPTPLTGFLIGSLLIGGPSYALCAAGALWWLRRRSVEHHRWLAVIAPIAFIPFLALGILVTESLGRVTWSLQNIGNAFFWSVPASILFGYTYLASVFLLRPWVVREASSEGNAHAA